MHYWVKRIYEDSTCCTFGETVVEKGKGVIEGNMRTPG